MIQFLLSNSWVVFIVLAIIAVAATYIRRSASVQNVSNKILNAGADLAVEITRPDAPDHSEKIYAPGDTLHVTVRASSDKPVKFKQGRVSLIRLEKFVHEEDVLISERTRTDIIEQERRVETNEFDHDPFIFLQDGEVTPTGATFTHAFTLPKPTPPTFKGSSLSVTWLVRAVLERPMATDIKTDTEIGVVHLAPETNPPLTGGASDRPEEEDMSFQLPKTAWRIGETLEGKVVINPKKDIQVNALTLQLTRHEQFIKRTTYNDQGDGGEVKIAVKEKLTAGTPREFPFSIPVPNLPQPTFRAKYSSVRWVLSGLLDHTEHNVKLSPVSIIVYTGDAPATNA